MYHEPNKNKYKIIMTLKYVGNIMWEFVVLTYL